MVGIEVTATLERIILNYIYFSVAAILVFSVFVVKRWNNVLIFYEFTRSSKHTNVQNISLRVDYIIDIRNL